MTVRVAVLSQTAIVDDPRVRKQISTLADAGFEVLGIGVRGGRGSSVLPIEVVDGPRRTVAGNVALAPRLIAGRLSPMAANRAYWSLPYNQQMYRRARQFRPQLVHANDWRVLPIAVRLKREQGSRVVYDSHEWAIEEQIDQMRWRLLFPPFVRSIEEEHLPSCDEVITVADAIADLYQAEYRLPVRPTVIRNVPPLVRVEPRSTPESITVLYQGVFNPNRGLETLIRSVPQWPDTHRLVLRGLGPPRHVADLTELVRSVAPERITVEAPAPADQLVEAASTADIGIHALPLISRQTRFALPNKLFEYMMAGLALCVSDAPEMARIVREFDVGVLLADASAGSIAEAMVGLDRTRIDHYRANALRSAEVLNWGVESSRLLEIYGRLSDA